MRCNLELKIITSQKTSPCYPKGLRIASGMRSRRRVHRGGSPVYPHGSSFRHQRFPVEGISDAAEKSEDWLCSLMGNFPVCYFEECAFGPRVRLLSLEAQELNA